MIKHGHSHDSACLGMVHGNAEPELSLIVLQLMVFETAMVDDGNDSYTQPGR